MRNPFFKQSGTDEQINPAADFPRGEGHGGHQGYAGVEEELPGPMMQAGGGDEFLLFGRDSSASGRYKEGRGDDSAEVSQGEPPATPSLSETEVDSLLFMIEEEKLAGDLYESFYEATGLDVFNRIAQSEDHHYDSLVRLAERADIDLEGRLEQDSGVFVNEELQSLYNDLSEQGSLSQEAALNVGLVLEQADIEDLSDALSMVEDQALVQVYSQLLAGSEHHLAAFDFWLAG